MRRAVQAALLVVLALGIVATPVSAVETGEDGELPRYEEIGTQNEISERFRPEGFEQPSVFPPIIIALLAVALVVILVLLFLYLSWQPRFTDEAQRRRR